MWVNCLDVGNDIDVAVIFSPSKKTWKKAVKPSPKISLDQEKGEFKSLNSHCGFNLKYSNEVVL